MNLIALVGLILVLQTFAFSQREVASFQPSHAVALEEFLSKNKELNFLSEQSMERDELVGMRKDIRKDLQSSFFAPVLFASLPKTLT